MVRKLSQSDFKKMPWKNGQGVTTEIYRIDTAGQMGFRVSSARVEKSGPFSDFTGYDRTLVNLGPGVMNLSFDHGPETSLMALEPFQFDGGKQAYCHVTKACDDLNTFSLQERYFSSTFTKQLSKPVFIPLLPSSGLVVFVIEGELCANVSGSREILVGRREALIQEIGAAQPGSRIMLASSSAEPCLISLISFREK